MNDQDAMQFLTDGIEEYTSLRADPKYADAPAVARQWLQAHDRQQRALAYEEGKNAALAAEDAAGRERVEHENPYEDIEAGGHTIVHLPATIAFGRLEPDKWLLLKTLEEAAEMVDAGKAYINNEGDAVAFVRFTDEYADVVQTLANLAAAFDLRDSELHDAMSRCVERNRARGRL